MGYMLSRKLRYSSEGIYEHWCPGCKSRHPIWTNGVTNSNGATWQWNGNVERPTFTPSIHISIGPWTDDDGTVHPRETDCHYFITDGQIQFCADSRHALSGQTVELPDWPDHFLADILMTLKKD